MKKKYIFRLTYTMLVFALLNAPYLFAIQIFTENSPPYHYLDKGKLRGFISAKVNSILQCANIKESITVVPWKRAYQSTLTHKNTLLFAIAKTPERENKFIWLTPLFKSTAYFFKLKKRTDIKLSSINDLSGFSIGLLPNDYKNQYLFKLQKKIDFEIVNFSNRHSQISMLVNGRFDLTADNPETFKFLVAKFGYKFEDFERLIPVGENRVLYLVLNKDSDEKLIQKIIKCTTSIEMDPPSL